MCRRFYLKFLTAIIFQQARRFRTFQRTQFPTIRNLQKMQAPQTQVITSHIFIMEEVTNTNHHKFHMIINIPIRIALKEPMNHLHIKLTATNALLIILSTPLLIREIHSSYLDKHSAVYLKQCQEIKKTKQCIRELNK